MGTNDNPIKIEPLPRYEPEVIIRELENKRELERVEELYKNPKVKIHIRC